MEKVILIVKNTLFPKFSELEVFILTYLTIIAFPTTWKYFYLPTTSGKPSIIPSILLSSVIIILSVVMLRIASKKLINYVHKEYFVALFYVYLSILNTISLSYSAEQISNSNGDLIALLELFIIFYMLTISILRAFLIRSFSNTWIHHATDQMSDKQSSYFILILSIILATFFFISIKNTHPLVVSICLSYFLTASSVNTLSRVHTLYKKHFAHKPLS
jgi:uncharacterized protein involved in response to NO